MANLFSSSIGKKLVMSISGVFLVLFLLFHATMNIVALFSTEAYDAICHFLGANWYALAGTLVLAGGFLVHILMSIIVTLANRKARGNQRYATVTRPREVSWASKNMFVLGVIVVGFIGLHLWQFWAKMQLVEILGGHEVMLGDQMVSPTAGSAFIAHYFSNLCYVICYVVWLIALWFHLNHGFWSAFQSLGWNNQLWLPRLQSAGRWVSTIIVLMFLVVVIGFYLRSICCSGAGCAI